MNALSVKLPHDLHASLASEARRRNVTRSALVRDILAEALVRDAEGQLPSCAELAGWPGTLHPSSSSSPASGT